MSASFPNIFPPINIADIHKVRMGKHMLMPGDKRGGSGLSGVSLDFPIPSDCPSKRRDLCVVHLKKERENYSNMCMKPGKIVFMQKNINKE